MSSKAQPKRHTALIAIAVIAFLAALIGGGLWLTIEFGKAAKSIQLSELRLVAVRQVCRLVGTYVEKSNYTKWPRSWEDLFQSAEDGGYSSDWPHTAPPLQNLISIDFGADLKTIQQQEVGEFTAIQPSGLAEGSITAELQGFLARIRGPVEWKDPREPIEPVPTR